MVDSLGDRMKLYESNSEQILMNRVPVIVRVDGKGFSKWTKKVGCKKPFDNALLLAMKDTMVEVASNVEGCVFGYTQSDEMTFVIRNDQSLESQPWFGNRLQKICSVMSSMTTAYFNILCNGGYLESSAGYPAFFDARVFTVPDVDEAANCLVWRQNDATKNSVSSSCYYEVGKKIGKKTARGKMHGLNRDQQQELLFQETGLNWNDYPVPLKRGIACYWKTREVETLQGVCSRNVMVADEEIPIFSKDREWLMEKLNFKVKNEEIICNS